MTTRKYGWWPSLPDKTPQLKFTLGPGPQALPPLSPVRDLTVSGFFPPIWDQGDTGCHSEETEVLTQDGWKGWPDCQDTDLLGTMNQRTGHLEFQQPLAFQRYKYKGPMHVVEHKSLNYCLTPTHRMYQRRWSESSRTLSSTFSFLPIAEAGWYYGLPSSTTGWLGTNLDKVTIGRRTMSGNDLMALIGLICSDGWAGGTESNWNRLSFCCFREDRIVMVRSFAQRFGFLEQPARPGVWYLSDSELAAWFRANAYIGDCYRAPFKRVPNIVKEASTPQIRTFLKFFGDQSTNRSTGQRAFYSSSKQMVGDLQELHLRCGIRSGVTLRPSKDTTFPDGHVTLAENCAPAFILNVRSEDNLSIERKRQCSTEPYNGFVFCATVPNGTLVTRLGGQILISGNSCTGHGSTAAIMYQRAKQGLPFLDLSRLFPYYNARVIDGDADQDNGSSISSVIQAEQQYGDCAYTDWPTVGLNVTVKPPDPVYQSALKHTVLTQTRILGSTQASFEYHFKHCMDALLAPPVFGFTVYSSFESDAVAKTGIVPMPTVDEEQLGGHCVIAVAYDDTTKLVKCRNSWGPDWGDKGHFYLPYAVIFDSGYASDFRAVLLEAA